jgi:hypothetical protein
MSIKQLRLIPSQDMRIIWFSPLSIRIRSGRDLDPEGAITKIIEHASKSVFTTSVQIYAKKAYNVRELLLARIMIFASMAILFAVDEGM